MPTYASPVLPNASGLAHGSPSQQWTYYGTFVGTALSGVSLSIVNSSTTMVFSGSTAYEITLTGNVTSSTFSGNAGYYIFVVLQNGAGGWTFAWPSTFVNAATVHPTALGSLTQVFFWDLTKGYAIAPGMIFP